MHLASTLAVSFAAVVVTFTATWLVQLRTRNAGVIDPVWAAALGGLALLAAASGEGAAVNRLFVALGGGVWAIRLASHLWRRQRGQPEDARYHALRERWGDTCARNMFWFFQLQALTTLILSISFFVPAYSRQVPSMPALAVAIAIWCIAVAGEASSDRQLRRFLADPAHHGEVCRIGWWRYSRHPNYFFECLHWLAYVPLVFGTLPGWLTLVSPVLMAWLLMKVSGIPILEARLAQRRAGYREYMRTTSALVPWPPKASADRTQS
ncbi:conserved membrane protein of unknown function [Pararobbsia alpina]|uniref:DUF1295 domain-containing protein n=1 Tax=Pararobbsia alpina TaxID=621374 RepID=UPI0039A50212